MKHIIVQPTYWDKKNPIHVIETDNETLIFSHRETRDFILVTIRSVNKRRELMESFSKEEIKDLVAELNKYLT